MGDLVPSYILKLDRAREHLDALKAEIAAFDDSHPYTVTKHREGSEEVWLLQFTSPLPPHVSLVGADFVHNVRSGLDHLAAALVPASRRDSTSFPIFWEGVWEPPAEGDGEQALKDRARWNTIVKRMKPEAVTILKELQPTAGYAVDQHVHLLSSLNRFWNGDKHTRLPFVVAGLRDATVTFTRADGTVRQFVDADPRGLGDNARLRGRGDEVDVKVEGTMEVVIRVAMPDGVIPIVHHFEGILAYARTDVVERLIPFVHVSSDEH